MADWSMTDEITKGESANDEDGLLCCNPAYHEVLQSSHNFDNQGVKSTYELNIDKNANGFIVEERCDEEDKGPTNFIPLTQTSTRALPQLVFLDSDDSSSTEHLFKRNSDLITNKGEGWQVCEDRKSYSQSDPPHLLERFDKNTDLTFSQQSRTSQHSSDSDLITDHTAEEMTRSRENSVTLGGKLWHCHDESLKLPPDLIARNQLIAVSIFCFLFMIGETVGKYDTINVITNLLIEIVSRLNHYFVLFNVGLVSSDGMPWRDVGDFVPLQYRTILGDFVPHIHYIGRFIQVLSTC